MTQTGILRQLSRQFVLSLWLLAAVVVAVVPGLPS